MSTNALAGRREHSLTFRPEIELLEERCLPDGTSFLGEPIVPVIDAGMKAHLRAQWAYGQQLGNRSNVFAKVGDSITAMAESFTALGSPLYNPSDPAIVGIHAGLAPTVHFFRSQPLDSGATNSFNHVTRAAKPGWTTADLLNPGTLPLAVELSQLRPAFALIMLGSNDLVLDPSPELFRGRLGSIVQLTLAAGTIPVLSTVPDSLLNGAYLGPRVAPYNQAIADVAHAAGVPLWNYWLALQPLPLKGISADGVHPSSYPWGSGIFTGDGLQFGFNMRNLTAVEILDKLKRIVVDNGPPDCPVQAITAEVSQYLTGVYQALLGRLPEPAAVSYWGLPILCGVPAQEIAQRIWESAEHRGRQVDEYYATFLQRAPDQAGRDYWVHAFLSGAGEVDVRQAILSSAEYLGTHASDADYVTGLFQDVLGYDPEPENLSRWQQSLQHGLDRPIFARIVLTSTAELGRALDSYYRSFLGRSPEPGAERYWMNQIAVGEYSLATVGSAILASEEFWQRALAAIHPIPV